MKKRDKKLDLTRETIRDLSAPETRVVLQEVVGGASCTPNASTHCSNLC